ncbi:CFS1-like protein [Flagelloscypha sp. PMI_526]|nr:CFS1-like protein [Flagelloscypha sp. PMI_526]
MERMNHGQLKVLTFSHIYVFGDANDKTGPKAELRVTRGTFWIRLATMGDLGFSEAYMYGDVECDDLVSLFHMFLLNRENISNLDSRVSWLFNIPQRLTSSRFLCSLSNSRSNISAHYDISNKMFAGFLSEDMTYSCAIFEKLDEDLARGLDNTSWSGAQGLVRIGASTPREETSRGSPSPMKVPGDSGTDELEEAQMRKLKHIIAKARIQPGHKVLEIGSGWGSMAILICETFPDVTVDTLTLSSQQKALAESRIAAAGFEDRVHVHLMDYRDMPSNWEHWFDRVVSVEMIEAVGKEFLDVYFAKLDWALSKDEGVGVVQVITIPEARFERYMQEIDFIRKWIFPGGFLPSLTFLLQTLQRGSKGQLVVDSVANIGPHYSRTLREWRRRFLSSFEDVIVPALKEDYPEVMSGRRGREEIEVFRRKWLCTCYCEVGFDARVLGDHIISFAREGYRDFGCDTFS